MRELLSKLAKLITWRRGLSDDLREEMDAHLELEIQENLSRGMPPEHARQLALRRFGNTTLIHERARETWTFHLVETILQDLRYGLRMLARSPVLTFTAVLSLALGIGANTALFSVLNAVMLRLLPVQQPEQLMLFTWSAKAWPEKFVESVEGSVNRNEQSGLMTSLSFSSAGYESLRRNNSVFLSVLASSSNDSRVNVGIDGRAEAAMMQAVSGNYFHVLGVPAVVGRTLQPTDDRAEAPPSAVLSHAYWQRRFGGDESIAGRVMVLNGAAITIVGVGARGFFGVEPGRSPDLFVPLSFQVEQYRRIYEYDLQQHKVWWLTLIGRLKPGTGLQQANTELATLFQRELTGTGTPVSENAVPWLELTEARHGLGTLRDEYSTSLFLLTAIVALVLLIACANVSGLLLSRASARQKEISLRLSMGAPRMRIVRQLLTESVALGLVGGTVGLLFAGWISTAISVLFAGAPRQPITLSVRPDANVFAFTAAISIASGILFGLAPALRGSRMDVYSGLRLSAGTAAPQGRGFFSGRILVIGQVALCLPILIAAGLLVQTLQHLQQVDLGFDRHHLLLFDVQPGLNGYKSTQLAAYYSELEQRIRAIPGVKSVGMSQIGPIGEGGSQGRVEIPGFTPAGKGVPFYRHWVSPGFFETLEIPLLLGRLPGPQDISTTSRVVVINQKFVRDYLRGANPLGLKFDAGAIEAQIVGVVADTKYGSLRKEAPATAYFSYLQYSRDYPAFMTFEVRTRVDPAAVIPMIQREARGLEKNIPLVRIRTQNEVIGQALFLEEAFALISGTFGIVALLLACVGLYGTMSYSVSRRSSEIGIRLALGARPASIRKMVLRETAMIVLAGIVSAAPLAWFGTRLLESQLFGLSAHHPQTILFATAALVLATIVAGYLPARRASRVDPVIALGYQ